MKYTLDDFNRIMFGGIQQELPKETIDLITTIANQVGATDYIRTPQFPKRAHQPGAGIGETTVNRRRQKTQEINDNDWDVIRNFQTTELKKNEGVQASIDEIRKHLNKITEKTYDKMFPQICNEIDKIVGCGGDEMSKVGESIFTIASGNTFYSNMYAKMYKSLMQKYPVMRNIFNDNFKQFANLFTSIEYCSPNENYDKFCENNKNNNNRRALGLFYINLMKEGIIKNDDMMQIIKQTQDYFLTKISEPGNRDIADELSENLYIFITKSNDHLEDEDDWDDIITNVKEIANYKTTDYPSITNKSVFKHMDMLDEI
jgi:hemoglobin-like flavoprotein